MESAACRRMLRSPPTVGTKVSLKAQLFSRERLARRVSLCLIAVKVREVATRDGIRAQIGR